MAFAPDGKIRACETVSTESHRRRSARHVGPAVLAADYTQVAHFKGTGRTLDYNLTHRERQILIQLLELSQQSKEHFDARIIDPDAAGPSRELARIDFGGGGQSMQLTKRDLRLLKDEGLIYFRWDQPDRGTGRLSSRAFHAVSSNFNTADPGDAAALAAAASKRADVADEQAIALRFQKITTELVNLTRQLIDADEAS